MLCVKSASIDVKLDCTDVCKVSKVLSTCPVWNNRPKFDGEKELVVVGVVMVWQNTTLCSAIIMYKTWLQSSISIHLCVKVC